MGTTCAVGCFPGGASPYGVEDLSGNVWEWTRSLYRDHYHVVNDERDDCKAGGPLVVRGGSWISGQGHVRCANRVWLAPDYSDDSLGFRLVMVSPSAGRGHRI
ncbi:MAG TPA: hypothetical protein ENK17_06655 [Anaerolineae bacterium]|nr:hypothetical protein [Anaerolineae bacterium]